MEYAKAEDLLPEELLREIQRYVHGGLLYIPNRPNERKKWGEGSGAAQYYAERNAEIRRDHRDGMQVEMLSQQYGLSIERIRKIIYMKK